MPPPRRRRLLPLPSSDAIAGAEDLMTEILIRLPEKSICRFKSVSKRWNSLISHPHFSLLRIPHSVSGFFVFTGAVPLPKYFFYKYGHLAGKQTDKSSPFKSLVTLVDDPFGVKIMDSCNGLFLIRGIVEKSHYVCNPTTKQFAIIPPPSHFAKRRPFSWTLVFDPFRAPNYKIVSRFSEIPLDNRYQIEIYSSETGAWRISGDLFTTTIFFNKGVFFNGMIHWPSESFETWLLFDVDQECLTTLPMPTIPDGRDKRTVKYFGHSHGHFHLICGDDYSDTFDVLEMESDCSKFFVKYHVYLDDIRATFPQCPPFAELSILHLAIREVEEESSLVLHIPGMVVSYNFKDKTLKKLCNLSKYVEWVSAHQYIETFVRI